METYKQEIKNVMRFEFLTKAINALTAERELSMVVRAQEINDLIEFAKQRMEIAQISKSRFVELDLCTRHSTRR